MSLLSPPDLREVVVRALLSVAPESDPASLPDTARVRDELDIDSMDFLNFVVALHAATGVDVPEADYPKIQTIGDAVVYLTSKAAR